MESEYDYKLNIDIDTKSSNTWQLWINHKVVDENGEVAGAICAGINVQGIMQDIFGGYNSRSVAAYIVDSEGTVQLDNTISAPYVHEDKTGIESICRDDAFIAAYDKYRSAADSYFNHEIKPVAGRSIKLAGGGYASISPIDGSDWSIIIIVKSNMSSDLLKLLPLIISLASALLLYVIGSNAMMKSKVFKPINLFIRSIAGAEAGINEIYGMERDDEIGELARSAEAAFETIRQSNALTNMLLDATPLACQFWNRDLKIIRSSRANIEVFGLQSVDQLVDNYLLVSPEYQPNGQLSSELAHELINRAFEEGYCVFEWMHQTIDGEPLPSEITLVRLNFGGSQTGSRHASLRLNA